jgi:hypothetical protein
MWNVNVESGLYFSNVERKCGKWIVFLMVVELGQLWTIFILLFTVDLAVK